MNLIEARNGHWIWLLARHLHDLLYLVCTFIKDFSAQKSIVYFQCASEDILTENLSAQLSWRIKLSVRLLLPSLHWGTSHTFGVNTKKRRRAAETAAEKAIHYQVIIYPSSCSDVQRKSWAFLSLPPKRILSCARANKFAEIEIEIDFH